MTTLDVLKFATRHLVSPMFAGRYRRRIRWQFSWRKYTRLRLSRKSQTWRQPSNTLPLAITIGMPESSYGTSIPSVRQSEPSNQTLPASWTRCSFFLYRTGERGGRQTLPNLREDKH